MDRGTVVQNGMPDAALSRLLTGIKVIALDWNGTAVSDVDRAMRATNLVLSNRNLPTLSLAQFRSTFMLPMHRYFESLRIPTAEIVAANDEWNRASAAGAVALSSGITRLLEIAFARHFPVGVISAASADVVLSDARRLGIADSLAFVRGSTTSKSSVLLDLAERFDGRALYCGDTEYDISEARKAGAVAVAFSGGYRPAAALVAAGADCTIDSFDTLATALTVAG